MHFKGVRIGPGVSPGEDQLPPSHRRDRARKLAPGVAHRDDLAPAEEGDLTPSAVHGLAGLHHPKAATLHLPKGQPRLSSDVLLITSEGRTDRPMASPREVYDHY